MTSSYFAPPQTSLSEGTLDKLADLFCQLALSERETNLQREVLVKHPSFCLMNAFKRFMGRGEERDYITSLDLLGFMRDNGVILGESECYLLITAYDGNKDGKLSLRE